MSPSIWNPPLGVKTGAMPGVCANKPLVGNDNMVIKINTNKYAEVFILVLEQCKVFFMTLMFIGIVVSENMMI
jgi:hypothetical protein